MKKLNSLKNDIESKLKFKANDEIKLDKNLFLATSGKKTYNIRDIEAEIESSNENFSSYLLNPDAKEEKTRFLLEEPRPFINLFPEQKPNFERYYQETINLLSKEIKPNEQITILINDSLLQEWVRHGIDNHKGKHEKCAFCGGTLPSDIWTKLDAHFNKESEELRAGIEKLITTITNAVERINNFIFINKENYYSNLHKIIAPLIDKWEKARNKYSESLQSLISQLNTRKQNIFETIKTNEIENISEEILGLIVEINKVAKDNNTKASTLINDQHHTRYELRMSEIARFAIDIDFIKKSNNIDSLEASNQVVYREIIAKREEVKQLVEKKESLESQAKDETKGAELVNQHISDFFGHGELRLVAEGESPNIKFKITREGTDAKNLSEGECSLISFCYFIAKLEDEIKSQEETRNLVVYIDDPISSLDSNHIFFMFSLIETIIAKPNRYKQLFISTQNLDFLKYLKRLTSPNGKGSVSHYLIERKQKGSEKGSFLVPMPTHLKDYVTEFNYLFNEIYKVYKEVGGDKKAMISNTYNQFYNLPNNMRKFLECYLFYRFPNSESPLDNLSKIFNGNTPIIINRFINEYSHLTYIDRGWKPIDVDEAEECAKIVIEKIREQDPEQFAALLQSVT
ncbi:AAA family ATPase [Siccationidurans soli]|uniref:AAA family ATPase n=1 Tax=Hymenobacter negativus TaxID=2795026 RepID=A0ABS3QE88_9BACT|nr:AAA family ATPase [Hymenobacter negativus]MBO2009566.1 AAA family ATPase [Hymenobacter negativus]